MPDLSAVEFGLLGVSLLLGLVFGWTARGNRCAKEKIAVSAGWQGQINAQQAEHDRLAKQNKSLMEQISENQASYKDSALRAQELSDSLREAFARRDELHRQVKDVRGNLEVALAQRDKLQALIDGSADSTASFSISLKEKDDKIFYLSRELQSWQDRVPPLVDRFRTRDLEAREMEAALKKMKGRLDALEKLSDSNQTRIEAVDSNALADGLIASNDQYEETAENAIAAPTGQQEKLFDTRTHTAENQNAGAAEQDSLQNTGMEGTGHQQTDDLRLIKGIGPAIQKTLNDLGIFRFGQIADISEFDVDRVAQRLRGFRSRLYREDWIGQARALEQAKNKLPG